MSVVKVSRSALRAQQLVEAGLVDRRLAARERLDLLGQRSSRATTRWPSSAKQAAVTSPTQPTPITPIGSLPAVIAASLPLASGLGIITLDRARHPHHLVVGQRVEQALATQ